MLPRNDTFSFSHLVLFFVSIKKIKKKHTSTARMVFLFKSLDGIDHLCSIFGSKFYLEKNILGVLFSWPIHISHAQGDGGLNVLMISSVS